MAEDTTVNDVLHVKSGRAEAQVGKLGLSPRENAMAIFNNEPHDYEMDIMDAVAFAPDPILMGDACAPDGEPHKDSWGVSFVLKPGAPGKHPMDSPETLVIKDIEEWEDQLVVPDLDDLDWSQAQEVAKGIDRSQKFCAFFSSGGLFERSHHLMGFENALCNYLEYPDEMSEILRKICDYKKAAIIRAKEAYSPDLIFFQDDWGNKQNLFLPPSVWDELIFPLQMEIADTIRECEMFYVHHCDCYSEPLAPRMVELGVDVWQGVIPENDIVKVQEVTEGKLAMQGGFDVPAMDAPGTTEEEIRALVRKAIDTYCPGGRFFPGAPGGGCFDADRDAIMRDEAAKYGRQWTEEHWS